MNHVDGNTKQNQYDNDQADRPLKTPGIRVMESQKAEKRRALCANSESFETGEHPKARTANLAAIGSEEKHPQNQALTQPPAHRCPDLLRTAIRTFHKAGTLS